MPAFSVPRSSSAASNFACHSVFFFEDTMWYFAPAVLQTPLSPAIASLSAAAWSNADLEKFGNFARSLPDFPRLCQTTEVDSKARKAASHFSCDS